MRGADCRRRPAAGLTRKKACEMRDRTRRWPESCARRPVPSRAQFSFRLRFVGFPNGEEAHLPTVPLDPVPMPHPVTVHDPTAGQRSWMPGFDLPQDARRIVDDTARTRAQVDDFEHVAHKVVAELSFGFIHGRIMLQISYQAGRARRPFSGRWSDGCPLPRAPCPSR